jgi:multicomponent Na+:H+ antiporter subunit C
MTAIEYSVAIAIFAIGLYCAVSKTNLIKKIIGLAIMTKGIHLFLISIGFRTHGIAPIITNMKDLATFNTFAVDPLPQALVLTSIVIDLSITALALTFSINAYRHFKTLNTDEIRGLKG